MVDYPLLKCLYKDIYHISNIFQNTLPDANLNHSSMTYVGLNSRVKSE